MKNLYIIILLFFVNGAIAQTTDNSFVNTKMTKNDSVFVNKKVNQLKEKWRKDNYLLGKDSIQIILRDLDCIITPMRFLNSMPSSICDLSNHIEKKAKYPVYSIILTYKDILIGECLYDVISRKYRMTCSSTIDKKGLKTHYYDQKYSSFLKNKKKLVIATGYKYPKFENIVFFESSGVLMMIDYFEQDTTRANVVDDSFFINQ